MRGRSRLVMVAGIAACCALAALLCAHIHRRRAIRNVVLISIDTCRAGRLSCYGYKRQTTPNIDALASNGVLFTSASTPVPFTLPAHSSMMTGTYPPTHGVHLNNGDHLADSNITLAEIMRDAGYQTAAFIGAFPLDTIFGLNQGFDTYDCQFRAKRQMALYSERNAEELTGPAMDWLGKNGKKPFLLFLHYYDAHFPYEPPPPFNTTYAGDLYAGEIAYVDRCIGHVVDQLHTMGIYDNTLIIITGDHGESLGEHGEQTHGFFMYQATLRVPLVIRAPVGSRNCQVNDNVNLVDIVPTVLDLLGLGTPAQVQGVTLRAYIEGKNQSAQGKSGPGSHRQIYCESVHPATFECSPLHGVIEDQWKYIRAARPELYDLKHDPGEQNNVLAKEVSTGNRLRDSLEATLMGMNAVGTQHNESHMTLEDRKRLRSLGYAGGGAGQEAVGFDPTREDPKDFLPIFNRIHLASTKFSFGHNSEAEKELLDIIAQRPDLLMVHRLLVEIAMDEHRTADAKQRIARIIAILTDARAASKQIPRAALNEEMLNCCVYLGNTLMAEGKLAEAAAEFEKALLLEPKLLEAINNLALCLQRQGKIIEAIAQFQKALDINPRYPEAHNNLGLALKEQGKVEDATAHFQKALEIDPAYAKAHNNLAVMLRGRGQLDEAILHFRKALEVEPDYVDALYNLGSALEKQGITNEAIACFKKAATGKEQSAQSLKRIAIALQRSGQPDDAIRTFARMLETDPSDAEVQFRIASILRGQGKVIDALARWREGILLNPDSLPLLNEAAWMLATCPDASIRNGKEAVELAGKAVTLTGGKVPELLDTLAAAYAEAGQFEEAMKTAEQALALAQGAKTDRNVLTASIQSHLDLYRARKPYRSE